MHISSLHLILYAAAALAWALLLWPYPKTAFMAACVSCAFFPFFRRLQRHFPGWRGIALYMAAMVSSMLIPFSIIVGLVVPQAAAGIAMFKTLRDNNFQLPAHWVDRLDILGEKLSIIPGIEPMLQEITQDFESILSEMTGTIIGTGVSFVGSTLTVLWLLFLFVVLSTFCSVYAQRIFTVSCVLLRMPKAMLLRFIHALRGALRGVLLGVLMVALAQGTLCGIGFAFAGVKQPAFWGMLATMVAPIPVVGTAVVWVPLCFMLWFTGSTFEAIGLAAWGMMAVGGIDNILRPLFLQQNINAPLFLLVLAILCGLASFGSIGLIAGPLLVSFAIHAVKEADTLYQSRK